MYMYLFLNYFGNTYTERFIKDSGKFRNVSAIKMAK